MIWFYYRFYCQAGCGPHVALLCGRFPPSLGMATKTPEHIQMFSYNTPTFLDVLVFICNLSASFIVENLQGCDNYCNYMRIDCPHKTGPTYVFSCRADKTIQLVVDIMVIQLLEKVTKVRCVWVSVSKLLDAQ